MPETRDTAFIVRTREDFETDDRLSEQSASGAQPQGAERPQQHVIDLTDDPGDVHGDRATAGRGRDAASPSDIPKQGWKDVAVRVKDELKEDQVPLLSAGVAFYLLLALFPALAALVSI